MPDAIAWKEHLLLLSEKAVHVFKEVAHGCAEFREFVSIRGNPYYVLNVLATENILDLDKSELVRAADGSVHSIRRYIFTNSHASHPIFKLINVLDGPIFVTHAFARTIVDAGLLGFEFRDPAVNETSLLFSGANVNVLSG